ncbi:GNAT family N-acetyltransferase [Amycolatopsis sp. WGS_07]|uniref:GNAT family N-acetyltransferase n=1 Tax=Amycolatopsis sp. WGS_07 TaxID=3076764 RepID=UPI003873C09B
MRDDLLDRVRQLWLALAGVDGPFPGAGQARVLVSPGSKLGPPGWVGVVALGEAVVVTVPSKRWQALGAGRISAAEWTDPDRLRQVMPIVEVLGPATLAYFDGDPAGLDSTETVSPGHPDLEALLTSVPAEEADESGIAEITSPAAVLRRGRQVIAAAGYRRWPGEIAQLSVLTAPEQRGRGLARAVAGAAVAHAVANRLLPQWRARHDASRRVARALGFRELGVQVSTALS